MRLGGRCYGHKLDTDKTAGKTKNAHFHFMEAEIALKREVLLPESANVQHSSEEGVPSPAIYDWLSTEGGKKEDVLQQEVVAESLVLPQVTPRPSVCTSQTGKSYTARSRFWRRYTKREKRVYDD